MPETPKPDQGAKKVKVKQHEHTCPGCNYPFKCRGKACEGHPEEKEVYCAYCWESFSD